MLKTAITVKNLLNVEVLEEESDVWLETLAFELVVKDFSSLQTFLLDFEVVLETVPVP